MNVYQNLHRRYKESRKYPKWWSNSHFLGASQSRKKRLVKNSNGEASWPHRVESASTYFHAVHRWELGVFQANCSIIYWQMHDANGDILLWCQCLSLSRTHTFGSHASKIPLKFPSILYSIMHSKLANWSSSTITLSKI